MTSPVDDLVSCRSVAILAFAEMEVLDYAGPYEVFNVAGELSATRAFSVTSVGVTDGTSAGVETVTGRGGFKVVPDCTPADCPAPDIVVIPGGAGSRKLLDNAELLRWLRAVSASTEYLLSVCTGSLVLAAAGLLDGKDATTHHSAFDELAALSPTARICRGQRFVQSDERIWTSGGISAGVDLALEIVGRTLGPELQAQVIDEMEWGWPVASER